MQLASGLSLSFVAILCFFTSAAHGVYGNPPGMFAPSSKNVASGGDFGSVGNGWVGGSTGMPARDAPRPASPSRAPTIPAISEGSGSRSALIQLPERSGFPSGVLGGGAVMTTAPCASRGTPDAGYLGHCAATDTEQATTKPITPETVLFILSASPPQGSTP